MSTAREEFASVLAPVRHVLLDFDGPVCSVFAGVPAADVARRLAELLTGPDGRPPGDELTDLLAMLRHIADVRPELVPAADDALVQLEVEAVAQARPTEGAVQFLEACAASDRQVWLVSNNATAALDWYVDIRISSKRWWQVLRAGARSAKVHEAVAGPPARHDASSAREASRRHLHR